MPGIFSRGQSGANAPVIPPKVPTPGPEAPTEVSAEEAALPVTAPVPIVRPSDQEPVGPDLDEAGGGIAVDEVVADVVIGPTGRPVPVFPDPRPLTTHGHARVISMCNQKGGVGKTTTTINLGASLAEFGRKVLLVDFDPQGSLSVGLGFNPHELDLSIYNLLMQDDVDLEDVVCKTNVNSMDLLPSNIDLSAAEVQLVGEVAREQTLARVLTPAMSDYDVIIIDCQPSLGLLTINALTAAHGVIVPLACEYFALRGVALLKDTIDKVSSRLNPRLRIVGVLGTMYDGRTLHGREVLQTLVDGWTDAVFHTVIRRTVKFSDSTVAGEPILSYASNSAGAQAYRQLAREVWARCHAE